MTAFDRFLRGLYSFIERQMRRWARFSFSEITSYSKLTDMGTIQYLSAERLEELKQELQNLKTVSRREIADRIEAAKALGDLSENAEYHEAKEAMAHLEGRIYEISELLKNARVIEEEVGAKGVVRIGSTVKVDVNGREKTFQIVGSNEADPLAGKISNESPIGSSLLGAKVGDTVEVESPGGISRYRIIDVA